MRVSHSWSRPLDLTEEGVEAKRMAEVVVEKGLGDLEEIWGSECVLYYPELYAGQTDLCGIYQGRESIVDFKQLSFILKNLKKNGFEVNIYSYNREKYNWKTIHKLHVTGGHKDRAKLYNKLLPFMKIKHKIEVMKNTIKYNEISNMIDRRKNEME